MPMLGCLRGCLGKIAGLVILLGLGAVLWLWGPDLVQRARSGNPLPAGPAPSPELAESTLDRFEALRGGEGDGLLRLGDAELTSVVRFALPGLLPQGMDEPTVTLRDGRVVISADVAVASFPELPSLDDVIGLLPDTVRLQFRGTIAPFDEERVALFVDQVEASRIPLPDRYVPRILEALGRPRVRDLAADAVAIPIPEGLEAIYVLRDSMILVADR